MKNILIKLDHDKWKVQLGMPNNFISSIDNDEVHVMHSKRDNIEIMINYKQMKLQKIFLIHSKIDIKII